MYKVFNKSEGDAYDAIARQAYGTPERAGDIAKINNNIKSGQVVAYIDKGDAKQPEKKEVCLVVGDESYTDFPEYSLIDGLAQVRGAVFVYNKTDVEYNFKIGDDAFVFDEDGLFIKGYVANVTNALNRSANWSQVEIKSLAGVMVDSDMPYPQEFTSLSVKSILSELAAAYSQSIEFSNELELDEVFQNEIGTSFASLNAEKVWEFMARICSSRGLLLTDTGNGLFVGRYKANTEEKLNLIDGECLGVQEMRLVARGDGLARYYEINSQYPETASATVSIPFPVPIIKRFNSNDYNAKDLESVGARIACSEIGKHFKLLARLSENKQLRSGSFAVVKNEKIKIFKETDFVIERVERKHPDTTLLVMTLPCAYTYEIPGELPQCS